MVYRSDTTSLLYAYRSLEHQDEIRLFKFVATSPDIIMIEIFHAFLNQWPEYRALSYCWGEKEMVPVACADGNQVLVTRNCQAALHRLAAEEDPTPLCIDSICINQSNNRERNQQVAMMREVYSRAVKVQVYLGEESDDSSAVMDLLGRTLLLFIRMAVLLCYGYDPISEAFLCRGIGWKAKSLPRTLKTAIGAFLDRDWFRRIWVLQEVCSAGYVEVMCADQKIPWKAVQLLANPTFGILLENTTQVPAILQHNLSDTLLQNLSCTRGYLSSEPADKIYALLGISSDVKQPRWLDNDVNLQGKLDLRHQLIERQAVQDLWRSKSKLPSAENGSAQIQDFLSRIFRSPQVENVWRRPWQLNELWRSGRQMDNLLASPDEQALPKLACSELAYSGDAIRNLGNITPNYTKQSDEVYVEVARTILLRTQCLDILGEAEGYHQRQGLLGMNLPSWVPNWTVERRVLNETDVWPFKRLSDPAWWYRADLHYAAELSFPGNGRLLCAKGVWVGTVDLLCCPFDSEGMLAPTTTSETTINEQTIAVAAREDDPRDSGARIRRLQERISIYRSYPSWLRGNRRLITTKDYSGFAPPETQLGDCICVLLGARVPFILRPQTGNRYNFVGEFLHADNEIALLGRSETNTDNLMFGGAFRTKTGEFRSVNLRDFHIV